MKKLILISHGAFCEGLKESAEMILGEQPDIVSVPLLPEESAEDFQAKLLAEMAKEDGFTVFADLMGGTPANVAAKLLMQGQQFDLYAGMNLPMIVAYVNGELLGEAQDIVGKTKEYIVKVNDLLL
ncbi:PTS sugar transporter subunit IIA [Staphylococcus simulans]|uniref:PTS sugar transporter subunit IIA n=1 Tax=Staphylococcus simulans TaxID=1286 RepID=UPI000D02E925|nr:PTS fructose transporter subunit IIA [Staphylococcus simulans]PTJ01624.1 PTS fructose transporter subunit IIA [Staphylococcus simulans]PTJ14937.1 PTS fructose transporter subunit IIA [Staphylococcus simulans]PTJ48430.1 PTS fructose transporter subunit IIA [Staphylococcus simulans]PTJ83508.1 PTS fructose transporter subunit IIA [Staphylococcus simulans]